MRFYKCEILVLGDSNMPVHRNSTQKHREHFKNDVVEQETYETDFSL